MDVPHGEVIFQGVFLLCENRRFVRNMLYWGNRAHGFWQWPRNGSGVSHFLPLFFPIHSETGLFGFDDTSMAMYFTSVQCTFQCFEFIFCQGDMAATKIF